MKIRMILFALLALLIVSVPAFGQEYNVTDDTSTSAAPVSPEVVQRQIEDVGKKVDIYIHQDAPRPEVVYRDRYHSHTIVRRVDNGNGARLRKQIAALRSQVRQEERHRSNVDAQRWISLNDRLDEINLKLDSVGRTAVAHPETQEARMGQLPVWLVQFLTLLFWVALIAIPVALVVWIIRRSGAGGAGATHARRMGVHVDVNNGGATYPPHFGDRHHEEGEVSTEYALDRLGILRPPGRSNYTQAPGSIRFRWVTTDGRINGRAPIPPPK